MKVGEMELGIGRRDACCYEYLCTTTILGSSTSSMIGKGLREALNLQGSLIGTSAKITIGGSF